MPIPMSNVGGGAVSRKNPAGNSRITAAQGKQKQVGPYMEQGGAARSNNFTSVAGPMRTPVQKKSKGGKVPMPNDILAASRGLKGV